jgi:hypothetical protein
MDTWVALLRSIALLPHDWGSKGFYPGRDEAVLQGMT